MRIMVEDQAFEHLPSKVLRSLKSRGAAGTVQYMIWRLRDEFSERMYDLRHGFNTRGQVAFADLSLASPAFGDGRGYRGVLRPVFRRALGEVRIRHSDFAFIDLGCGKGRPLLFAAEYPFRRVTGVEIGVELARIAARNVEACGPKDRRCAQLDVTCADVCEYEFPPGPLLIFMFNPFYEAVMGRMVENLRRSLEQQPRPLRIVYMKPMFAQALDRAPFLRLTGERQPTFFTEYGYKLYSNDIG
jgi:SAM-dependent methyltransferase